MCACGMPVSKLPSCMIINSGLRALKKVLVSFVLESSHDFEGAFDLY